jgi:hypothetical protein
MARDIHDASKIGGERLALVSVGLGSGAASLGLSEIALPVQAKLKRLVGGAMQGVNARIAHRIVSQWEAWFPDTNRLKELIDVWVQNTEPLPKYGRTAMTDHEVLDFISHQFVSELRPSKSGLLRKLRDSGRACEQQRFGSLYSIFKKQMTTAGEDTPVKG